MKYFIKVLVLSLFLLSALNAYAEIKHNNFTKEEIKKMAKTRAIIETKFGDIELSFFPETAPGHVNNLIELAKKRIL